MAVGLGVDVGAGVGFVQEDSPRVPRSLYLLAGGLVNLLCKELMIHPLIVLV